MLYLDWGMSVVKEKRTYNKVKEVNIYLAPRARWACTVIIT